MEKVLQFIGNLPESDTFERIRQYSVELALAVSGNIWGERAMVFLVRRLGARRLVVGKESRKKPKKAEVTPGSERRGGPQNFTSIGVIP